MMCTQSPVVTIACCTDSIIIRAGLLPNTQYYWVLTDERFGHLYQRLTISNETGDLTIPSTDLPEGLLSVQSRLLKLTVKDGDDYLNLIPLVIKGQSYDEVYIQCTNINNPVESNSIVT